MRRILAALLLIASWSWTSAAAPAQTAHRHCATQSPRVAKAAPFTLPETAQTLNADVVVAIDVGSDGRVRDQEMLKGSGDAAVDAAVHDVVMKSTYRPAETKCVAYSNSFTEDFRTGPEATPGPLEPAKLTTNCTPLVAAFVFPVVQAEGRRGTAIVAVSLDAAATVTGITLRQDSGSATLDTEALRIARTAQFGFTLGSACRPQATTYALELTFE